MSLCPRQGSPATPSPRTGRSPDCSATLPSDRGRARSTQPSRLARWRLPSTGARRVGRRFGRRGRRCPLVDGEDRHNRANRSRSSVHPHRAQPTNHATRHRGDSRRRALGHGTGSAAAVRSASGAYMTYSIDGQPEARSAVVRSDCRHSDGRHTIRFSAVDVAGNRSLQTSHSHSLRTPSPPHGGLLPPDPAIRARSRSSWPRAASQARRRTSHRGLTGLATARDRDRRARGHGSRSRRRLERATAVHGARASD